MRTALRLLAVYLGLSLFLGLLWLASLFPNLPTSPAKWLLVFVLALPLQLVGELVGHVLSNSRLARQVEQKTQGKSVSLLRIAYAIVCILSVLGLMWAAVHAWSLLRPTG
jgi:hypothetical protein